MTTQSSLRRSDRSIGIERFNKISAGVFEAGVIRNGCMAALYEDAIVSGDSELTSTGAIAAMSGAKTGRSPKDKRIVESSSTRDQVWWGPVNTPLERESFLANRKRAIEFLAAQNRVYVVDGYAGWDARYRLKFRVICSRPYHALFMRNMLLRPTASELAEYGQPDYVIYNAGQCDADRNVPGNSSSTSIAIDFDSREMIILGSQYAG
jgi:phosphoenolpyruvate carboxykinase (ATP)